eukprot:6472052-Amphidinium_carterae.4
MTTLVTVTSDSLVYIITHLLTRSRVVQDPILELRLLELELYPCQVCSTWNLPSVRSSLQRLDMMLVGEH